MLPRISSFIASLCLCASFVAVGPATAGSYDDALTAATLDRAAELSDLLERGIDPDTADTNGNTLLILAAREGNADVVALLLKRGAKSSVQNKAGDTALMLAALKGHEVV
ncbi:MAG: ankyrin repeat domain-containing protein, partial [Rhodocyclaceae bacterium]|nr:ankyrin repeat domain-containing protein [Rhodocyclaceae bacterium]